MARYDKRGVVIPAPLQGSDSALSGKRYGDRHRGPAVTNAYELWHCRIDLAERSERWPRPAELAQDVPEDQRADFLRGQANLEEVDRRISYAIRSGDLPIWVAPQGEPERLVATGALATIDKRSIRSGVFCPLSEEYKSEADRPWLWERPLFVKWDDWVRFAGDMDAERLPDATLSSNNRGPEVRAHLQPVAPKSPTEVLPPEQPFVTLSHAVTWIAFGISMNGDQLEQVLMEESPGEHHSQEAVKAAVRKLLDLSQDERMALIGKYRESHRDDERRLRTALIEPLQLANFRKFNWLDDELSHGTGLRWWRTAEGTSERMDEGGSDSFIAVRVNRADLLRESPANVVFAAPPYHGGAGQLRRLDGIAVPDAIRLNDAVIDLAQGISNGPDLSDAETAIEFKFYSSDSATLREWQTREVSMFYVREAIQSGRLTLYTMLVNGAHAIDRYALSELTFGTLRKGIYEPRNAGDPLAGTAFWVLFADWQPFRQTTLKARSAGTEKGKVSPNRQLNHEKIVKRAREMREAQSGLSLGSAAASIRAELPPNPKTGKPRDQRGIERIIAHLWERKAT